jgi:hypothetical protein
LFAATLLGSGALVGRAATSDDSASPKPAMACARSLFFNFQGIKDNRDQEVPVWHMPDSPVFFFEEGMTIDADGAPNTYNADNTGIDDLSNAGEPGNWGALAVDRDGEPFIQGADDPFPGYYVSMTALADRTKRISDPRRYVDASKIPYIVLPHSVAEQGGATLGDFGVVLNLRNGKVSNAIFADIGTMGEGSVALADNLGIFSDARRGGTRDGLLYIIFGGSGNGKPRSNDEINEQAAGLLESFGGAERVQSCSADLAAAR